MELTKIQEEFLQRSKVGDKHYCAMIEGHHSVIVGRVKYPLAMVNKLRMYKKNIFIRVFKREELRRDKSDE